MHSVCYANRVMYSIEMINYNEKQYKDRGK